MEKKMVIFLVITLLGIFIFSSLLSAQVNYKANTIEKYYNGGEFLRGSINISVDAQPVSSILKDNFNNSINLLEFIKLNNYVEGSDYNCTVKNCLTNYKLSSSTPISNLNLVANQKKLIGFRIPPINGLISIDSINLSGTSNIGELNEPGVSIDFTGWNVSSVQSYGYTNVTSSTENFGCLDQQTNGTDITKLSSYAICQKINFISSPAFVLGAIINNISSQLGAGPNMQIYYAKDGYSADAPSCNLPRLSSSWQKVNCTVENPGARAGDYYVCITANDNTYEIKRDTSSPQICGGYGTEFGPGYFDTGANFNIFARSLKFNNSKFFVNADTYSLLSENSISADADSYIETMYGRNCSKGCIIPILINSKYEQNVDLSGSISYYQNDDSYHSSHNEYLYNIELINSTFSSKSLNLNMEKAKFILPLTSSQNKLSLSVDNSVIKSDIPINITPSFSFDVTPKVVLVGIDTSFSVLMNESVTSINWNFGDNSPEVTTQIKKANHKYTQNGEYSIQLEVNRADGKIARKVIPIIVGNPTESFKLLITKYRSGINNDTTFMYNYDSWVKDSLKQVLNITNINSILNDLESKFSNATDEEKKTILDQLISLNVPYGIYTDSIGELPADVGFEGINIEPAIALSEGDYSTASDSNKEKIKLKIIKWNTDKDNILVSFKHINKKTDSGTVPFFTQVNIKVNKKSSVPVNLVINYPKEQLIFKENYNQNSSDSQTIIPLGSSRDIELLIPESVEVQDLGIYVSPDIKELGVVMTGAPPEVNERPNTAKWFYVLLILIFLAIYIALQEWYKFRYESHLFKNKDDLYNIVNFIFNARIGRNSDNQIRIQLSKYNWTNEQLNYAFNKIDGKRTGMWEIPIFKFIENRRVTKEIEKRKQQNMGDGRFIKTNY